MYAPFTQLNLIYIHHLVLYELSMLSLLSLAGRVLKLKIIPESIKTYPVRSQLSPIVPRNATKKDNDVPAVLECFIKDNNYM